MGYSSWIESYTGDLDTLLGYSTSRTVLIRDRWLGLGLLLIKLVIIAYVVGFQLIVQQVYLRQSELETSVRLQVQEPEAAYRWGSHGGDGPPYCAGVKTLDDAGPYVGQYTVDAAGGTYTWTPGGASLLQRACDYLDRATAIPLPETAMTFVTTETRATPQVLPPECADVTSQKCAFGPKEDYTDGAITRRAFVADPEYFTVLVDHGMNAVSVPPHGLSRTVAQMSGEMLDLDNVPVNPCADYAGFPAGCPKYVKVGVAGSPDIIPIATLFRAAGVASLDVNSSFPGSLNSAREGGIVLLLEITYSNYFYGSPALSTNTLDTSDVHYTYTVSAVPATEFKFETSVAPYGNTTAREYLNRHGIRVIVATSGRIGYFDLQVALVNLSVAFGLLSISVVLMDCIALSCCPLRAVYKQYKERATVDMSDLRKATSGKSASLRALVQRFETDPFCVDAPPSAIAELMGDWAPGGARASAGAAERASAAAAAHAADAPLLRINVRGPSDGDSDSGDAVGGRGGAAGAGAGAGDDDASASLLGKARPARY